MKRKLQVFVSSTFTDLREERQAAVEAILKAGHIPAGMELFTAGDVSQMKTIERWIDESDVYMLILGGRYGSLEKDTGISYTELEFDYAKQQGKRLFSVVIDDEYLQKKVKRHGQSVAELKYPRELDLFRSKVLSNISAFFSDTKDVKLSVYESLSDFEGDGSLMGWVSAAEVGELGSLQEEIVRLREENATLRKVSSQSVPAGSANSMQDANLEEISDIIRGINVLIPEELIANGKKSESLFDLTYAYRTSLINGVQNRMGMSEQEKFLYFNVGPKLQIHGLVNNDPIDGVRYRRTYLNDRGLKLVAAIDRQRVEGKRGK